MFTNKWIGCSQLKLQWCRARKKTTVPLAPQLGQPSLPHLGSSSASSCTCAAAFSSDHWCQRCHAAWTGGVWTDRKFLDLKAPWEWKANYCKQVIRSQIRTVNIGNTVKQALGERRSGCNITEQQCDKSAIYTQQSRRLKQRQQLSMCTIHSFSRVSHSSYCHCGNELNFGSKILKVKKLGKKSVIIMSSIRFFANSWSKLALSMKPQKWVGKVGKGSLS